MNNQVTVDGQSGTIQSDGMVKFGSDDRKNVRFYRRAVLDPVKSRELGRRYETSHDYFFLQEPGERDTTDRPATEFDKARFPRQWAAYQQGRQQIPNGTPIDVLFPQNPEIPANLHTLGVHTVEQLANLTEHGTQTIGIGASQFRAKAREFLDAAKGGASIHRLQKQIEERDNRLEVQANQIAQLKSQLDRLSAQVNQGIHPDVMARPSRTIAQATFADRPTQMFSNDGDDDLAGQGDALNYEAEIGDKFQSSEPMFTEPSDASGAAEEMTASAENAALRKRGWPAGKPRGPRNQ